MECCCCGTNLYTENPRIYFCKSCFSKYKDDILSHAPWVTFLINDTARIRRREKRDSGILIHLGSDYDLSDDRKLIRINYDKEN